MGSDTVLIRPDDELGRVASSVIASLVRSEATDRGFAISLPIRYPGGSTVSVHVSPGNEGWIVHDNGSGFLEAEMLGGVSQFRYAAQELADKRGLHFDRQTILSMKVPQSWLANAVAEVGEVSRLAVMHAADRLAEAVHERSKIVLVEKLAGRFGKAAVTANATVAGGSNREWPVDAMVLQSSLSRRMVFNIVTGHPNSIAAVFTKFSDLADAPTTTLRYAVKHQKAAIDAANVILLERAATRVVDLGSDLVEWFPTSSAA